MNSHTFRIDREKIFPTLPHTPIVEAVLQWKAAATVELEEAVLGAQLTSFFSGYRLERQHDVKAAISGSPQGVEFRHSSSWVGFQLTKEQNGKREFVAQFKKDGLIFSRLAPYVDWESFVDEALKFWTKYVEIQQPSEIAQISTRYISEIHISGIQNATEYIDEVPQPLGKIGAEASGFFHQDSATLTGLPYAINLIRTVPSTDAQGGLSLIVDIDVMTTNSPVEFKDVPETLRDLRFIKNEVFFGVMKDAKQKFGGDSQ